MFQFEVTSAPDQDFDFRNEKKIEKIVVIDRCQG